MNRSARLRLASLALLLIVAVIIWYAVLHESRRVLAVAFLDVGQGDAIFIESPAGNQMLIDGGPNRSVLRGLGKVMPFYDRRLDVVVATHPDLDHIGGLPDVFERYAVGIFLEPGSDAETGAFQDLSRLVDTEGSTNIIARRGMVVDLGGGARLDILFPDRDVSELEANNTSIIARLVYGETEVMLSGDAGRAIEEYVVSLDGESLASDILKAGHHGSNTSSAESFVGIVDPEYVVISAGKDNRYGHPHKEVVDRFNQFGAAILGTYESGTIVFESDGRVLRRK